MSKTRKRKTQKKMKTKEVYAICVLHDNKNNVHGHVKFSQKKIKKLK